MKMGWGRVVKSPRGYKGNGWKESAAGPEQCLQEGPDGGELNTGFGWIWAAAVVQLSMCTFFIGSYTRHDHWLSYSCIFFS